MKTTTDRDVSLAATQALSALEAKAAVKSLRAGYGFNQSQIARSLNVNQSTVARWESGDIGLQDAESIARLDGLLREANSRLRLHGVFPQLLECLCNRSNHYPPNFRSHAEEKLKYIGNSDTAPLLDVRVRSAALPEGSESICLTNSDNTIFLILVSEQMVIEDQIAVAWERIPTCMHQKLLAENPARLFPGWPRLPQRRSPRPSYYSLPNVPETYSPVALPIQIKLKAIIRGVPFGRKLVAAELGVCENTVSNLANGHHFPYGPRVNIEKSVDDIFLKALPLLRLKCVHPHLLHPFLPSHVPNARDLVASVVDRAEKVFPKSASAIVIDIHVATAPIDTGVQAHCFAGRIAPDHFVILVDPSVGDKHAMCSEALDEAVMHARRKFENPEKVALFKSPLPRLHP